METILALTTGILYACGLYLILRRNLAKLIIGLGLLGHAANLLIFTSAGLVRSRAPWVPPGQAGVTPPYADPLPQALILTAIVISFGVLAFAVVLAYRAYSATHVDDVEVMRESEE